MVISYEAEMYEISIDDSPPIFNFEREMAANYLIIYYEGCVCVWKK